jgi:hypothetical protein
MIPVFPLGRNFITRKRESACDLRTQKLVREYLSLIQFLAYQPLDWQISQIASIEIYPFRIDPANSNNLHGDHLLQID